MGQEDETTRKGPLTQHEDFQLVFYVHMFGDRRWDFIAKVSGLKRTGKSCRLRWVNYLNPGPKRGKPSPLKSDVLLNFILNLATGGLRLHANYQDEQIMRSRTIGELMRKLTQEKKRSTTSASPSSSSSLSQCSSSSSRCTTVDSMPMIETKERSFYDTGGVDQKITKNNNNFKSGTTTVSDSSEGQLQEGYYWMDDIWTDLELLEDDNIKPFFDPYSEIAPSLTWDRDSCLSTSWTMDGQEEFAENNFHLTSQHFSSELVD